MKTQKRIFKFLILILIFIMHFQGNVFANDLTLVVTTDKNSYKIGDIIETTIDWKEKMQASSFKIGYDEDKLEFVSASINKTFYNSKNEGEISINWVSLEEVDLTQIKIQFKALKEGEATIKINEVSAFADGNLTIPTSYDVLTYGTQTAIIKANDETNINPQEQKKPEETDSVPKQNEENINLEKREDDTTAQKAFPKTGIKSTIVTMMSIMVILTAISILKNKKYSDI